MLPARHALHQRVTLSLHEYANFKNEREREGEERRGREKGGKGGTRPAWNPGMALHRHTGKKQSDTNDILLKVAAKLLHAAKK